MKLPIYTIIMRGLRLTDQPQSAYEILKNSDYNFDSHDTARVARMLAKMVEMKLVDIVDGKYVRSANMKAALTPSLTKSVDVFKKKLSLAVEAQEPVQVVLSLSNFAKNVYDGMEMDNLTNISLYDNANILFSKAAKVADLMDLELAGSGILILTAYAIELLEQTIQFFENYITEDVTNSVKEIVDQLRIVNYS